jgi:hypothetical protein
MNKQQIKNQIAELEAELKQAKTECYKLDYTHVLLICVNGLKEELNQINNPKTK